MPTAPKPGPSTSEQIVALILCPGCNKLGHVIMENSRAALVRTSAGFHLESGRAQPGEALIVCDDCDTVFAAR